MDDKKPSSGPAPAARRPTSRPAPTPMARQHGRRRSARRDRRPGVVPDASRAAHGRRCRVSPPPWVGPVPGVRGGRRRTWRAAEHRRRRDGAAGRHSGDHRGARHGDAGGQRHRHAAGSGVITQVLYKEGQMVKKGELLATIDPQPFEMRARAGDGGATARRRRSSTRRACSSSAIRRCSSRIRSRARRSTRRTRW